MTQQSPTTEKPDEHKRARPDTQKPGHQQGEQIDDNIDDLGRNVNDPDKVLDQPTRKTH